MAKKEDKGKEDKFVWGKDDKIQIFDSKGKEITPKDKKPKKTSALLEEVKRLAETSPETRETLVPLIREASQSPLEED